MDPEILARDVVSRYAECDTYRDRGASASTTLDPQTGRVRHRFAVVFTTAFERSTGRLRFEYRDRAIGPPREWRRCIIVRDADRRVRVFWTLQGASEAESLDTALAAAAGVSHGMTSLVPRLLIGRRGIRRLVREGSTCGAAERDGLRYDVLHTGRPALEAADHFWIHDWAIHRIDHQRASPERLLGAADESLTQLDGYVSEQRLRMMRGVIDGHSPSPASCQPGPSATAYEPEFDHPLGDDDFVFDPGEAQDHAWLDGLDDPV